MSKTLLLVDGSSYLYRAFHAMAPLSAPDGTPTGALYGVLNMLRRLRLDYAHDYCCCVFDAKGKNFRHEMFADYKATRPPMPDELRPQAERLPEMVALMGWPVLAVAGVEADDVIGTLAKQAEEAGCKVVISTGDKDMAQLVSQRVTLINTMSNETLDPVAVKEKFGVTPAQIVDYLSLIGDKVDNVPGVEKCGPVTALKWLDAYGSLDNIMAHAHEISGKVGQNLQAALAHLPLSQKLITIKSDVDLHSELPHGLDDLRRRAPRWSQLVTEFQALGFKTWLKEAQARQHEAQDLFDPAQGVDSARMIDSAPATTPPDAPKQYRSITTQIELDELASQLAHADVVGFDTETTSLNFLDARLVGLSFAFAPGEACYVPVGHSLTAAAEQLPLKTVLDALKPYLEAATPQKIGQNIKYDMHVLANHGVTLGGVVGDSMLASYVVESHLGHGLDEMALRHLHLTTTTYEELCGKGVKQISFAEVALETATDYACQDADYCLRIEALLRQQMTSAQVRLYEDMEIPVSQVLFRMERVGVLIDKSELDRQSHELGVQIIKLEEEAYALAGQPFNLNSPKQLQEILFDKLEIPTFGVKKTATGALSTNESVLEKLALDYPLPAVILQNRGIAKLKNTYTDKLPELIRRDTGRVHTTYAQAVAVTGRLASSNPNLQNIPIRTEEGRRVRRAFIAPSGSLLVSADYSQIELRIMAQLSGDATLIEAFQNNEDVHRRTAAEVFHIAPEDVTSEQRRYAKTINFGLIYGMGQFGLARALDIGQADAKAFIERYFERYPAVAEYMARTKTFVREHGFVETLFGRRLYLPDIHSKNAAARAGAERAAINAPMQGTASDLVKRAMIEVDAWLGSGSLKSRMLMQVHDELILEVPMSEREEVCAALPECMARAAGDAMQVPLLAEVGVGENWDEAH